MIFVKVKISNFYSFEDTVLDLTYPRKTTDSLVDEFLEGHPNFRVKRVCVIAGANASGKTAIGKMLCAIQNYISGVDVKNLLHKPHRNKKRDAFFEVDYIDQYEDTLNSLVAVFGSDGLVKESYWKVKLLKNDSYESAKSRMIEGKPVSVFPEAKGEPEEPEIVSPGYKSVAHILGKLKTLSSWYYLFAEADDHNTKFHGDQRILEMLLKAFDPSIVEVGKISVPVEEGDESNEKVDKYLVVFRNGNSSVIEDGKISNPERLSRGTIESIAIAGFISAMISYAEGIFFLDEKIAYSHSEVELSILNVLINKLKRNSQLFFTTHNPDIYTLNVPVRSFSLLSRDSSTLTTKIIRPEEYVKKNDRNLKNLIQNDAFGTMPCVDLIDELID